MQLMPQMLEQLLLRPAQIILLVMLRNLQKLLLMISTVRALMTSGHRLTLQQ